MRLVRKDPTFLFVVFFAPFFEERKEMGGEEERAIYYRLLTDGTVFYNLPLCLDWISLMVQSYTAP